MIKNRLLQIRLQKGYKNAKDFAKLLEISTSMYSMLENNKRAVSLDNAFDIAEKLNMTINEIWYRE